MVYVPVILNGVDLDHLVLSAVDRERSPFSSIGPNDAIDIEGKTHKATVVLKRSLPNFEDPDTHGQDIAPCNRANKRRAKKRKGREEHTGHEIKSKVRDTALSVSVPVTVSAFVVEDLPTTQPAYVALARKPKATDPHRLSLEGLQAAEFQCIKWDGRTPRPLLDSKGRVFAVLAGQAKGEPEDWQGVCQRAYDSLDSYKHLANQTSCPKRGAFSSVNIGVTHGVGTLKPKNLDVDSNLKTHILTNPDLSRIASFCSNRFALWAPDLYRYYFDNLRSLYQHTNFSHLEKIYDKCVFPCMAANFGPNVCTRHHRDVMNCPFGWCAVVALGSFDPLAGGHLILDDLKIYIEFPPHSLILIPSATLTHANLPIQKNEKRASVTFFCAGALFRYIDCGFQTEGELKETNPHGYEDYQEKREKRWEMGVGLFSTMENLVQNNGFLKQI